VKDLKRIMELEAQIVRDKQRYRELERLEAELTANIPQQGFKAASTGGRYRDGMESLADSIRKSRRDACGRKESVKMT
jgi:hypothetical protein